MDITLTGAVMQLFQPSVIATAGGLAVLELGRVSCLLGTTAVMAHGAGGFLANERRPGPWFMLICKVVETGRESNSGAGSIADHSRLQSPGFSGQHNCVFYFFYCEVQALATLHAIHSPDLWNSLSILCLRVTRMY